MIDIVYAIGQGSVWHDNELRYSLRSVQRFLKNYRKVYIVGHCPSWIDKTKLIHIPFDDDHSHERNIMEKVMHACKYPQLSQRFLFMNDDHYLLTYFDAPKFPTYYWRTLDEKVLTARGGYQESVRNTLHVLKGRKKTRNYYDVHTPVIYDKTLFPEIMNGVKWEGMRNGFVIKSLYCNMLRLKGVPEQDCKVNESMSCHQLEKHLEGRFVFSTPNRITAEVATYLDYLYPEKSKYEL
jgi:hypothetical protein